ncbi:MAG: GAF domain-containing protein, partial [Xanthobacteraceae bacterium]
MRNFAAQAVIAIENTRLLNELRESLEQQTATSDVLRVISSSPGELQAVYNAMLENATRICEAKFGVLFRFDGEAFHFAAEVGSPPSLADFFRQRSSFMPEGGVPLDRLLQTKKVIHTVDIAAEQHQPPSAKLGGARSHITVPMFKDKALIGVIAIYRQEVRPFTDKQIALVQNFAAQAVIAIENTRLLNELRQRTTDLAESLEQQTATSNVLSVISSSPGALEPVFQIMLENATRLCEAKFGTMYFREGDAFRAVAMHGAPPAYMEARLHALVRPSPTNGIGRVVETKIAVQIEDAAVDRGYLDRDPMRVSAVELGGVRTLLVVPMLKEKEVIGAIAIYRQEVRPFTDKQIALVQNFAAQAVIAIENARLLNELRQRTGDLSESLEQQMATSEVLRVISSSPGELEPVFQAMLEKSVRICEAKFGQLFSHKDNAFHLVTQLGTPPALNEFEQQRGDFQPIAAGTLERLVRTKQVIVVADLAADYPSNPATQFGGARSYIAVPMLKEGELIGVIVIYRQEVRPFTEKQIELVQNFAAQAVIAIENTRLLNELRQSLEQQTATADVLRVISSSQGELEPVFQAILENATRICQAQFGTLNLYDAGAYHTVALHNPPPQFAQRLGTVIHPHRESGLAHVARTREIAHIDDIRTRQPYLDGNKAVVDLADLAGARTLLIVPMLNEGKLIGAISIYRQEVRLFADRQVD